MALADEVSKIRAEVRARQAEDGRKAMAEYEASVIAVRVRTEKLRALRLAREAIEAANKPVPVAKSKAKSASKTAKPAGKTTKSAGKTKTVKAAKKSGAKLADWLDEQHNSGRNT
jgi:hypothetical protein